MHGDHVIKTLFNSMHLRAAKIILGFDWNTPAKDVLTKTKYNWKMLKGHFHKAMEQPSTFNCQVWTEGFYNQACFDHSYVQNLFQRNGNNLERNQFCYCRRSSQ